MYRRLHDDLFLVQVDWSDEKNCFDSFARHTSAFYAVKKEWMQEEDTTPDQQVNDTLYLTCHISWSETGPIPQLVMDYTAIVVVTGRELEVDHRARHLPGTASSLAAAKSLRRRR